VGSTFEIITLARIKTNIIIIVGLSLILLIKKLPKIYSRSVIRFYYGFMIFIILSVLNVLFALNVERSFNIMIVSVIGPFLLFNVLLKIPSKLFVNRVENLVDHLLYSVVFFFVLGYFYYYYQLGKLAFNSFEFIRGGGGIWISNISTQVMILFFPLIFYKPFIKRHKVIFSMLVFFYFTLVIISLSRTALLIYLIISILIVFRDRNKFLKRFRNLLLIFAGIYYAIFILLPNYNIDIEKLYKVRFEKKGNLVQTTLADERFVLSKTAVDNFIERPLMGAGLGDFIEINKPKYTNSHNIFTNILSERGLLLFLLFLLFIIYYFKLNKKISFHVYSKERGYLLWSLKTGFIGFILIGMTGNDLFISSGFVNAWPSYIIIIFLTIQIKIYEEIYIFQSHYKR